MTSGVVHVEIQGQRFAVKSDLDAQYIVDLATYVDERMARTAVELANADGFRVAVIAALNIADELFRARAAGTSIQRDVLSRTADLERLVDAALAGSGPGRIAVNG